MKVYRKVLVVVALLVIVGGCYIAHQVHQVQESYYPMAGNVTVIGKYESGSDYYIVIEEETGEQFTLSCDINGYNQVIIGDIVNCERSQSIVTHKGEVHKIELSE